MKFRKTIAAVIALVAVCGFVLADTQDKTLGSTYGYPTKGGVVLFERTLDFSTSTHTGTASDVYQLFNVPAGSYVLGVGYEIESNGTYTGEDGTCTIDIGDGSDPDGWVDGANVETGQTAVAWSTFAFGTGTSAGTALVPTTNTLTNVVYDAGATTDNVDVVTYSLTTTTVYSPTTAPVGYAEGKLYATTDTIDMTLNNAADQLKITVRAIAVPAAGY